MVGTFHDEAFPEATGGVRPYTYSFTCAGGSLPSGMGFAPETRRFAGTPDARFRDSCTYSVTDSAQPAETVSVAVEVEVTGAATEPLDLPRLRKVGLSVGTFHDEAFPAATGGVQPYTYSFTCAGGALPSGMGFAPETRRFAGTPDARFRDSCTYSVTDSAQPAETVSVAVEVEVTGAATEPLDLPRLRKVGLSVGTFHDEAFPAATGGVQPYTYSFTCAGGALPSGMGFAPETRRFAGTPEALFHDSCTYSVTDSSQPAATVSRRIEVVVESLALPDTPEQVRFVIGDFRRVTLPAARGGVAPYTYTFTCAGGRFPPGVGFAPATRVLAGITNAVFHDPCTYTATDSSQPAATVSRDILVTSAAPESLDLPDTPDQRFVIGTFRSVTLPAARGGVAPYMYTFACEGGSLPSGVGFAPATRVLAGVADAVFEDSCTYTVMDSSQPAATTEREFKVTVESLDLPDTPEKVRFIIDARRSFTLPAARGGVAPYTYTFACEGGSLPSGVDFTPATRMLAGVADAGFEDSCTYTVMDSSQPAATVSREIEVVVESLDLPDTPERVRFFVGDLRSFTLPAARGGVAPYTYTFACEGGSLPSGVGFAPATRVLAGVADAVFEDSCTYTVTDSSQSAVPVSRKIDVTVGFLDLPDTPDQRFVIDTFRSVTLPEARGSDSPFTYTLTCAGGRLPPGVTFTPATRVLAGTADAVFGDSCTYTVTDSAQPAETVSHTIQIQVMSGDGWRFRTRTIEPGGPCALPGSGWIDVATMPVAHAGAGNATGGASYALPGVPEEPAPPSSLLSFNPNNRVLTYTNPAPPPILGTPNTYRYLVGTAASVNAANADDALCLDIQYKPRNESCDDRAPLTHIQVVLQVRDDAFWDENAGEYRCPDTTAPPPSSGAQGSRSNPVHEALGPVHARRASGVAHAAVRDRVLGWSPGAEQASSAIAPEVGLASLSGRSEGFDYRGTSQSASFGAETGAGAWQAGLVASFTHTELDYQAEAALAERGYRTGEHDTEILSLHPFAAWHASSGGHLWASVGAGAGSLSHRDDLGFRSWSRSDVRLFAYAVGASVPVTDVLSGELEAEIGIESFALDIEGGGRISSSLPTLRGRDWRAGLAWSAPIAGAPSLSVAYKRVTGDGPEGGRLEAGGSVSVGGLFDPRLTLIGSAEGSLGLGDYEHDSWGLSGGIRFAPGEERRGFGLRLDTRLESPDGGGASAPGMRGEAGYGLWSRSFFGMVRPWVGLARHAGDGSLRRALGIDLRDTPDSQMKVEVYERPGDRLRALRFSVRHRF